MLFITNIEHTSIMSPELMKLRIMIVSIKTKVLIKFGTSEIMCVDLRAKKLRNMYRFPLTCICEMLFFACIKKKVQSCHQLMKFRIMTVSIRLKVLVKFGASEMICVESRAKKL